MAVDGCTRIDELFTEALPLGPKERTAFLEDRCGHDPDLLRKVRQLLDNDQRAGAEFLERPAMAVLASAPASDGDDPLIGQQVGTFTIKHTIARGGMGVVYLAEQANPRRDVALKVMQAGLLSPTAMRRFEFESQTLARLQHPHIAHVYEAGIHEVGLPGGGAVTGQRIAYFAMEYVPAGQAITAHCDARHLNLRQRLALFLQVCDAVQYAHGKGVIHRDLKPANILVAEAKVEKSKSQQVETAQICSTLRTQMDATKAGASTALVKVIDFGVARSTDSDVAATTVFTDVGQLVGTLQYMSPEQFAADPRDLDVRSDVYGLGLVLYELLCGRRPYDVSRSAIHEAARIVREYEPARPSAMDRKLRGDLETIVLKTLEKDRTRRYPSIADLAADLRRYLNREPIAARPVTAWTRALRWATRHAVMSTAALTAGVTVAITLGTPVVMKWLLINFRPYEIVELRTVEDKISEVRLLSFGGRRLRSWRSSGPSIPFAHPGLIDRPGGLGGGRLAVLGFGRDDNPGYSRAVVTYNVDGNFDEQEWAKRIQPGELVPQPPSGINRRNVPDEFIVYSGIVCDIFKESPGDEIVAVHVAYGFTQCIIRIYDLAGNVLFEVWHDGTVRPYHLANSGLLVFSGVNGEKTWGELGYPADQLAYTSREQHPPVVFAIRPTKGAILHEYLKDVPGGGGVSPAWYESVRPPVREIELTSPWREDRDSSVGVVVTVGKETRATFSFDLNQDGMAVPQTRQRHNTYLSAQTSLPDAETFRLVPFEELLPVAGSPGRPEADGQPRP